MDSTRKDGDAPARLGRNSLHVLLAIYRAKGRTVADKVGQAYLEVQQFEAEARLQRRNLGYVPDVVASQLAKARKAARAAYREAVGPAMQIDLLRARMVARTTQLRLIDATARAAK